MSLNTDGSVKGVASPAGCGALIRDHQGRWVCGLAYKIGIMSPYIAELWGVCQGLIMARERNDSALIQILPARAPNLMAIGTIGYEKDALE
ncbi:hypothetical protein JHK87_013778 [Glycine soja]|nr:hypothetical protein JHK87_013778 [Glycine soja]